MTRRTFGLLAALVAVLSVPAAHACSLCGDLGSYGLTFRQEAALPMSKAIIYGSIANPRTTGDARSGSTDFHVTRTLRAHAIMKEQKKLVLPRYLPVTDKNNPPKYVLFCDVDGKKLDPYRAVKLSGPAAAEYVKKAMALDPKDQAAALSFFFRHLDDPDPEVSRDAFLEFARAGDADIAKAAKSFDASKIRSWLKDEKTPTMRLGVYAVLLGLAGKSEDAAFLRGLLDAKEERMKGAADGVMAGYIALAPEEGWKLAREVLADGREPLTKRILLMRTLRFYQGAQPDKSKPHLLKSMKGVLDQGDLADLAVEDLRRWKVWDLTADILPLYGKKGYDSPLVERGIIRYALCAPSSERTQAFLKARRAQEPDVVGEVEEGLRLEKEAEKR